jgi:hypothetical protein
MKINGVEIPDSDWEIYKARRELREMLISAIEVSLADDHLVDRVSDKALVAVARVFAAVAEDVSIIGRSEQIDSALANLQTEVTQSYE